MISNKKFIFVGLFIIFAASFFLTECSFADDNTPKSIEELQALRSKARLFLPNFVIIGENAGFKIVTKAFYNVELKLEYDNLESEIYTTKASDAGLAVFDVAILNDKNLIGKSVLVEAYVWSEDNPADKQKAIPQDNNRVGQSTMFDRVYITDKDSAKGFLLSPSQMLNQYLMNNNFNDDTGSPYLYTDTAPAYIRNMRDARDNVREVRQTINNSGRQ